MRKETYSVPSALRNCLLWGITRCTICSAKRHRRADVDFPQLGRITLGTTSKNNTACSTLLTKPQHGFSMSRVIGQENVDSALQYLRLGRSGNVMLQITFNRAWISLHGSYLFGRGNALATPGLGLVVDVMIMMTTMKTTRTIAPVPELQATGLQFNRPTESNRLLHTR